MTYSEAEFMSMFAQGSVPYVDAFMETMHGITLPEGGSHFLSDSQQEMANRLYTQFLSTQQANTIFTLPVEPEQVTQALAGAYTGGALEGGQFVAGQMIEAPPAMIATGGYAPTPPQQPLELTSFANSKVGLLIVGAIVAMFLGGKKW